MNFAPVDNKPPYFQEQYENVFDQGNGIPQISEHSMSIQDIVKTPFLYLQDHNRDYKSMAETAMKGVQSNSKLSKVFFSDENIKRIQK